MNKKILEKLGLSEDESNIYMYLLENPRKNLSEISQDICLNRPKLYKVLPSMVEMWLISKIIDGKRNFYVAENPQVLFSYFENIKKDFDTFIPEIQKVYQNSFSKPVFKHLKGRGGIKNIFMDIVSTLNSWDVFYRYSSRKDVEETSFPLSEHNKYKKIRNEKKLWRYVITNEYLNSLKKEKLDKDVVVIPKKIDLFEDNITKIKFI